MTLRTPLYEQHIEAGARMVDFAGWSMPVHYGSQIEEHHAVRQAAGMFDVSHMGIVDFQGIEAEAGLRHLLANDVARLQSPGAALYACMLNEQGGVKDDLIVYRLDDSRFRLVVNAGTRDKDLAWLRERLPGSVQINERKDLAMLAVQGPQARERVLALFQERDRDAVAALSPFHACEVGPQMVARTGYTGEDGFEMMVPAADIAALWRALLDTGVRPAGLGARDTLRLEAGMNLYGQDMDETVTPLESGLAWTVAWKPEERDFIGRAALEEQRSRGVPTRFVGLVLEGRGVLRAHQRVRIAGGAEGITTSGSFSPTLGLSIALARVPLETGDRCEVEIRGNWQPARVVRPPFARHGKSCIETTATGRPT
ncbi:MAG: glycine cleavage system aminomethyltransferase GcvT [Chromatiales bacterium]|nr:glycine cleavage system aminomethyltransferase GcvT [Chromatiales bacterium]